MTRLNKLEDIILTLRGIWYYNTFLKKSCFLPKEEMELYQYKKLKFLLIESYKYVPYYKETFDQIGFDPVNDFNKLSDIQFLPTLTKKKAREVRPYLNSSKYEVDAFPMRTSGSTGEPFEVLVSKNAWVVEQAVVWRHWKWSGYNFRDKLAMVRSYVPEDGNLFKRDKVRNFIYFSPFHLNDKVIANYLDIMIKEDIKVIRGYPSSVLALAQFVNRTQHAIPKLKLILVASEVLSDQDRATVEQAFRIKVTNHYGLAEICVMMGDCEKHEGLHNYDEYGYLELIDTPASEHKKIIGTNLHNLATPLIRYDTGDLAELASSRCSCKKTLPTIKNILGRNDSFICTPNGYRIPTVNFYTMFEKFQEVEKWQIVQERLDHIKFIVRAPILSKERLKHLENSIKARISEEIELPIITDGNFMQKHEGKIPSFISLLK